MNIEVRGAYGETNFGDDLLMCVFENFFLKEFPNAKLNFVGEDEGYVSKLLQNSEYMTSEFNADIIVYGGGTQFFAFSEPKKANVSQKMLKVLRSPDILFRKFLGKKVSTQGSQVVSAFLGFGLGPFYVDSPVIEKAQQAIKQAFFVGVRDEVSFKYCNEWSVDAFLGADVAFSSYFKMPDLEKDANENKRIGIIVRDWDWEKSGANYIDTLKQFYNENKAEKKYQFIILAPLKDKKWMNFVENEDVLVWDPEEFTIELFLDKLNQYDGFISARYHGAIIGALLGKPVICIEIEDKLKILSSQIKELKLWKKPFYKEDLLSLIGSFEFEVEYKQSLFTLSDRADSMFSSFKKKVNSL